MYIYNKYICIQIYTFLTFFLAYTLTFYAGIYSDIPFCHSIWHSILASDIYSDLLSDMGTPEPQPRAPAVLTEIWCQRLRSGSARHLELAIEVRQCPLRSRARSWDPRLPEEKEKKKEEATLIKSRDPTWQVWKKFLQWKQSSRWAHTEQSEVSEPHQNWTLRLPW